ncbi:MAG: 5-formyltetrahydrofolate cyclo-ligase [Bacteroidetes bacterium HGW-Bacteroidetes-6]|jgi:5-formyltetrahydrofolate cyclo-ligase|nr:MAG: 5-formyltetrahydrofolate cyclo-ligase [Bacteroidetes bacterium HGW-Bacteroidetes-6]
MDVFDLKKTMRKEMRQRKASISAEEKLRKSALIFNYIERQDWFVEAKTVMCYWSLPDEVFTHDFVLKWKNEKIFVLPKMQGADIVPVVFDGSLLREPVLGIEEPVGDAFPRIDMINIIIVPGVAFDMVGNRLGRGKAFYDRLLRHTNALKIGVCFDEQLVDHVPRDENDIAMDHVVYF